MFNALFLIYFFTVNGVGILCEAYQGRPVKDSGVCSVPWDGQQGCLTWPLRASSGTLSVVSSFQKGLSSCIFLWNLAPPEDRAPFTCLKDADFHGAGPRGPLTDGTLLSCLVKSLAGHLQGLASGMALLPPHSLDLVGFFIPSKVTASCCIPPTTDARALEVFLWSSVLFSLSYMGGKGHKNEKKVCWGCQPKGQEQVHSHLVSSFCVLASLNCEANKCLQYSYLY